MEKALGEMVCFVTEMTNQASKQSKFLCTNKLGWEKPC